MAMLAKSQSLDARRDMVGQAVREKCLTIDGMYRPSSVPGGSPYCDCWVRDMFLDKVVFNCDGKLYQASYSIKTTKKDGTVVTVGDPIEVEVAYKSIGESSRSLVGEALQLEESTQLVEEASGGSTITLTVIKPGLSKNNRFYPAAMLKRDYKVFEGAKMFRNHATEAEKKARPEGDERQWVGTIKKVWAEADGTVKATAAIIDPPFKAKLAELKAAKLLPEMGISIRAVGEASEAEVDGKKTTLVERFVAARSVDFVTFPGAGGMIEALESANDENDIELLDEARLRAKRPDLVSLIESRKDEEFAMEKTKEQLEQELKEANEKRLAAETKLQEAEATSKKAVAATELTRLLTEAKLPEISVNRLKKHFENATESTGMKETVDAEKAYISSLGAPKKVQNNGKVDADESAAGEKKPANLTEAFAKMGLNEKQAKIAANGR